MKIDEICINHNVVRIIKDIVQDPYTLAYNVTSADERSNLNVTMLTLGEIHGVIALADELKKVFESMNWIALAQLYCGFMIGANLGFVFAGLTIHKKYD